MIYKLYTDGATSKNGYEGAYGGSAWVLIVNDMLIDYCSKAIPNATNNICELTALIDGCQSVLEGLENDDVVLVFSDSAYCVNCYKQNWWKNWEKNGWKNSKKEPVANKELWQQFIPFFKDTRFKFEKCKGHSGDEWNEYVDKLAVKAKQKNLTIF